MKHKKTLDVIGTILLAIGFGLAFLPHAFHARIGLEDETHLEHVVSGIIAVITALFILIYNNKAFRFMKQSMS